MDKIKKLLSGNDRRSIGSSNEVVTMVNKNEKLFDELFNCLYSDDKIIRMRAADAIQKIVESKQAIIKDYKDAVLNEISKIEQQEVRWHVAQLIPHLGLTAADTIIAFKFLNEYLKDNSKIVITFSMQALADLIVVNPSLKTKVIGIIEWQMKKGSPAILSRGRKLLKKLESKKDK
jgi:hypothetical protein